MFIFWNEAKNVKRKENPIKLKRKCGNCNLEAVFYECEKIEEFKLYGFINLKDKRTIVMQCGECLGVYKAEDDPELMELLNQREANKRKEDLKVQEEKEKRSREETARRQKEFEAREKQKQEEIDDELEKLKKELGS